MDKKKKNATQKLEKLKCSTQELCDAYSNRTSSQCGITCHACGYLANSWPSLAGHMRRMHCVKRSQIKGTYLYCKARHVTAKEDTISGDERAAVNFVDDETKFSCLLCQRSGKINVMSKRRAAVHFINNHSILPQVVKTWIVHKDGNCIQNARRHKMRLTKVLRMVEAQECRCDGIPGVCRRKTCARDESDRTLSCQSVSRADLNDSSVLSAGVGHSVMTTKTTKTVRRRKAKKSHRWRKTIQKKKKRKSMKTRRTKRMKM
jgi:hypothetical protein